MEEKTYENKINKIFKMISYLMAILCGSAGCVILTLFILGDVVNTPNESYVYIIRKNNNTEPNLYNIDRTICMTSYFEDFPFPKPNIGYEHFETIPNDYEIYTLQKIQQTFDISVHFEYIVSNGGIKYDFNHNRIVIVAWDYRNIPELAQSLGCDKCKSWNINPISNITDPFLFDITWVIKYTEYEHGVFIKRDNKFEFFTVIQNLYDSIIPPIPKSMSVSEIINTYNCKYMSNYNITKW